MKVNEVEMRLQEHAARVKSSMGAPFHLEKEELAMTKNNTRSAKMKISLIAIAAVFLLGTTAFAAGGLGGWFSATDEVYDYIPTEQQVFDDIGYAPILMESFENGYSYTRGFSSNNEVTNDGGDVVANFKSATFIYEKDGGQIFFDQVKADTMNIHGEVMETFNGVDIYYNCYTNKIVPEDYELSEEDRAAEERGEIVISWGSDKVYTAVVESVQWHSEGVYYMLMQMDGPLSPEELCAMATEAIEY